MDDVPGEVELCEQPEQHVRDDVDHFINLVQTSGLSVGQLQQQPQV